MERRIEKVKVICNNWDLSSRDYTVSGWFRCQAKYLYALLEVLGVSMAEIEQAFKDAEKEMGLE